MKYIDEFRNKRLVSEASRKIRTIKVSGPINIMEVCGTHTMSFFKFGLTKLLPERFRLISGPGCPVCVSGPDYIDKAIAYSKMKGVIIATFSDMLRVPGSSLTLERQRCEGADIRSVYSPLEAVKIAQDNPQDKVIFLGVGFETTAPVVGLTILEAKKMKLENLLFFSSLKLIPPAMGCLLKDRQVNIQGFLCPGHVSSIIGTIEYEFIPRHHRIGCCVCGFEPLDMMQGINNLLEQIVTGRPRVSNQYLRLVRRQGNKRAQRIIEAVFTKRDSTWRGMGRIADSGLKIRKRFSDFDAEVIMPLKIKEKRDLRYSQCRCPDVLKGILRPSDCPLFSRDCTPLSPYGPCMVSSEGACNVYYKYR